MIIKLLFLPLQKVILCRNPAYLNYAIWLFGVVNCEQSAFKDVKSPKMKISCF